ncbi:MutS protein msh5, variant 2 [Trebouxia sp. C0009 RCD-2024]
MTVDLFVLGPGGPPSCKEQQPSVAWRNHALFADCQRTVGSLDNTATHVTKQFVAAMYLYSVKAARPVASCTIMHAPVSGASFVAAQVNVMQTHDDAHGPFAFQMLQLAKLQAAPAVIYTSSKSDKVFLDKLRAPIHPSGNAPLHDVRTEKASMFSLEQALRLLQNLQVRGMPLGLTSSNRLHVLNTCINLAATQQVCAAGALLAIMHREGFLCPGQTTESGDIPAAIFVEGLSEVTVDGFLTVDSASMLALQVFQEDRHPSAMGIGQSKEGFSVYGMLNSCASSMGRRLLRLWFLRPIINLEVLNQRQDAVHFFMHAPDVIKSVRAVLRKTRDIPQVLRRLQSTQGLLDIKDLSLVLDSIANLLMLRDIFASLAQTHTHPPPANSQPVLRNSAPSTWTRSDYQTPRSATSDSNAEPPLLPDHTMGTPSSQHSPIIIQKATIHGAGHSLVSDIIDFEQSEDGMMISYGVCEQLDDMKHTYHGLPDFLTKVVEQELARIPRQLGSLVNQQLWSILYMPQVGFVMRLEGQRLSAALEDFLPDYEFAFEGSGGEVGGMYYHTDRTRQLNAHFGDMLHKIQDLEGSMSTELIQRLCEYRPQLSRAVAVAAEVDCLLSLASAAREHHYTRPLLTRDNVLHIKQGRHMLTEMVVDNYIPNDTHMTEDEARVQVITGPNLSGKSCYTKQVALIVFLAHVGSFVPAAEATIGLTDRIFTRIASQDSVSVPQSTFMVDLSQLATMLQLATPRLRLPIGLAVSPKVRMPNAHILGVRGQDSSLHLLTPWRAHLYI